MDREFILREIRRTAEANGGKPLGARNFQNTTGIGARDWYVHWSRWGDAVLAAGLEPNTSLVAFSADHIIEHIIGLTRRLGHYPTWREWEGERHRNPEFPSTNVIRKRLGTTDEAAEKVRDWCRHRDDCDDVLAFIPTTRASKAAAPEPGRGYVYLIKSGRQYKIGKTTNPDQRSRQFSIQLPHPHVIVHKIETDDAAGIEAYWHRRFEGKRLGTGEWFSLTADDVKAFQRRRKFM